jgi:hypothetical protein
MADVRFRLKAAVEDLRIPANVVHSFDYGGPHSVLVQLHPPSAEEQAQGYDPNRAMYTSFLQIPANEKNEAVLADIAANRVLPPDASEWRVGFSYDGPDGVRIRIPGLSDFPEHFRTFIEGARRELADYAQRTVAVLRWRANVSGPHSPIRSLPFGWCWSVDGNFWHVAPSTTSVIALFRSSGDLAPEVVEHVRELVASGVTEPLGHNMFREASDHLSSDPRSAIVVGMAAAELATKRCIAILVPDAEWLALHAPSPPLEQILTEYLPTLPARNRFDGVVKPPPADVLRAVKKGVTVRNQLVHAGNTRPTPEDAIEILRAVRDLLWLLDYYSGNKWALDYLRQETRQALNSTAG